MDGLLREELLAMYTRYYLFEVNFDQVTSIHALILILIAWK